MRAASRTTGEDALVSSSGDQGSHALDRLGLLGRPDLDQPGVAGAMGDVPDRLAPTPSGPASRAGSAKTRSTASSSGSTERNDSVSGTRRQGSSARPACARERLADVGEHVRRRALEAVDRLLLVADREQRARHLARAGAGEELLRQRADHLPLHRAGILRLVDQDVVEAAVELVEHPLDRRRGAEQARGPARSGRRNRAPRAAPWPRRSAACTALPSRSSAIAASSSSSLQPLAVQGDEARPAPASAAARRRDARLPAAWSSAILRGSPCR